MSMGTFYAISEIILLGIGTFIYIILPYITTYEYQEKRKKRKAERKNNKSQKERKRGNKMKKVVVTFSLDYVYDEEDLEGLTSAEIIAKARKDFNWELEMGVDAWSFEEKIEKLTYED